MKQISEKLVSEWSPQNELGPENYSAGSNKKVWWLCNKGHEWKASVNNRTNGKGCPYCAGYKVCEDNCLSTTNPELINEWSNKNKSHPLNFTKGSNKKVWWVCEKGHEWEAKISSRTRKNNSGCKYCSGKEVCEDNNLSTLYSDLVNEWNFNKNKMPPDVFSYGSNKKVWWICNKGHEWETMISNRTIGGKKCPQCTGRKVSQENCLANNAPYLIKEFSLKNKIKPNEVHFKSNKKVWWICGKGHEWEAKISSRTHNGNGCPYCANQLVCLENCLVLTHYYLIKEWHDRNTITPYEVVAGSHKKVWWICDKGHEWKTSVFRRTSGRGCHFCTGYKVCEDNCLGTLNPKLAKEWHPTLNKNLTPFNVGCGSEQKVWWVCCKGHEWNATINSRHAGRGCPKCSGRECCENNCLAILNPELTKQWHPTKNGELTPFNVKCGSGKKVWWLCESRHEWESTIYNRNYGASCPQCGSCISKSSQEWLDNLGIDVKYREKHIKIANVNIFADAFVPNTNTIYEFDGDFWHGNPKRFDLNDIHPIVKKTYKELYKNTIERRKLITSAGYNLVYIWESDWKKIKEKKDG